jgi:putative acetyltransferase
VTPTTQEDHGLVTTGPISIRPAAADDLDRLLAVWRAAVEATHSFLTRRDVDWYEQLVRAYLPAFTDLRVAQDTDGTALGFLAQQDGEIHMLFVDPAHHGRGIGSALLAMVAEEFVVLRVDVNEQNPSGRRFYAARGFHQVGRTETDGQGRPFPMLHLVRSTAG